MHCTCLLLTQSGHGGAFHSRGLSRYDALSRAPRGDNEAARVHIASQWRGVAWPLTAHAQQSTMPVIGFLSSAQPQVFAQMIDAFRQGLNETGYVVGQNVAFEHRAAGSEYDRFRAIADDLVGRQVAVIFSTGGTVAALAAKDATSTIPIVFYMGGDPVKQGLVASLNRPGGNLTGLGWLGVALGAKRLELLGELVPNNMAIAMLVNQTIRIAKSKSGTYRRPPAYLRGRYIL